jgi:ferritin-like protein
MAKVTREMVELAGVNVDELLELLVNNAAAELTTYYYYTILRVNLIGLEGETINEIAETARIEDRNHTTSKKHSTYDLGQAILNEEIEHESWFSEFLGEGPSGHFPHRGDTSTFVSKFLI